MAGIVGIGGPLGPSPGIFGIGAGWPGFIVAAGMGRPGPTIPVGAIMKLLAIAKLLAPIAKLLALLPKLPAKLLAAGRRAVFEGLCLGGVSTHN